MPRINVQQGELAHWLQHISEAGDSGAPCDGVPPHIVEALTILLCVKETNNKGLVLTDKGRLALRMQSPDALHLY
jgi:hypothetical protein